ncbi:MAG TPA: hypothetical protein PLC53_01195 [Bacilli bacterium]|nr:hypothetical protein [Bacilli bacterium]
MKKQITVKLEQLDVVNNLIQNENMSYVDVVQLLNNRKLLE